MKAEATMTTSAERRFIFDLGPDDEALSGLREVKPGLREVKPGLREVKPGLREVSPAHKPGVNTEPDNDDGDGRQREAVLLREVPEKMVCSACRCSFTAREEQMEHYKLDWHRFNLRLKMAAMPPVTAEEFEKKSGAGDVSSISGSESDSEEEDSERDGGGPSTDAPGTDNEDSADGGLINGRSSSKVVFQNAAGEYLSVHRCVLQGKADEERDVGASLKAIGKKTLWIILMTGGGHFAGAVFQGREVLQHKTFHRYTVRAKRGTAQGLRDSQNRSHAPKSAGAALRRHNEAALVKDIQDLLASWAEHLNEAAAIFVRAPSYNKTILFGGRAAPLDRKDGRVRTLPFATRRATFREVQRVHEVLATVHIYGKDTDMSAVEAASKKVWKKAAKPPAPAKDDKEKAGDDGESSEDEEAGEIQLEMTELTLGTQDLREFEIYPSRHQRRRRRKKKKNEGKDAEREEPSNGEAESQEEEVPVAAAAAPSGETSPEMQSKNRSRRTAPSRKPAEEGEDESWEYGLRDALFTACKVGDVDALSRVLSVDGETGERSGGHAPDAPSPLTLLNKPIDSSGFTLLHVASAAAQKEALWLLLDAGANPALSDDNGQTPYNVAPDKDTRNAFRKYMSENPDRYDYSKAKVPGPLTAEMESKKAEKKKAHKAQKKQREKTEKDEKRKQEMEAEEKKRFASLSDREKRALAAEKRLVNQMAATGAGVSNIKRCWQCGESMLGKVPFQYMDFSFCSPRCVQAHRKANAPAGKN